MNANIIRNRMNVARLARLFAALALAAALVPLTPARAAGVGTVNVCAISGHIINEGVTTYENYDVVVDGCTDAVINGQHTFASLVVRNNSVLRHSAATTSVVRTLELTVTEAVTVEAGSSINVGARGYLGAYQSGNSYLGRTFGNVTWGSHRVGGSYGGLGGNGDAGCCAAPAYGDLTDPREHGSGGGGSSAWSGYIGGNGGGVIIITASTLTVDGSLLANGEGVPGGGALNFGGGGGGAVNLNVSTLNGNGTISANGGNGNTTYGGGGAGGRIAIHYTANNYAGTVSAAGGSGKTNGGAGTVFWKDAAQANGDLIVDNAGRSALSNSTPLTGGAFAGLTVRSGAKLAETAGLPMIVSGAMLVDSNAVANVQDLTAGSLTISNNSSVPQPSTSLSPRLVVTGTMTVSNTAFEIQRIDAGDLNLAASTTLYHPSATTSGVWALEITIHNAMTMDTGSSLNVSGRGYLGAYQSGNSYLGRTLGNVTWGSHRVGGSSGGIGGYGNAGCCAANAYGDFSNPREHGTGGSGSNAWVGSLGGNGGGVIVISASTLTVNGSLLVNGGSAPASGTAFGGGGGGAINLNVGTLSGSGSISAIGGNGNPTYGGGGAGGRIAIHSNTNNFTGTVGAAGGSGYTNGGAGTVFWHDKALINGGLVLDNAGRNALANSTPFSGGTFESLIVRNGARLAETGNLPMTVLGAASADNGQINAQNFTAGSLSLINGSTIPQPYNSLSPILAVNGPMTVITTTIELQRIQVQSLTLNNATLTHPYSTTTGNSALDITVAGLMTISSNSSINANGRGYLGGLQSGAGGSYNGTTLGRTNGNVAGVSERNGGSHGGAGGVGSGSCCPAATYDDANNPRLPGAGGSAATGYGSYPGGYGGGIVTIEANSLVHNGSISAGGTNAQFTGGGGAGGSVNISVLNLSGAGTISANGGSNAGPATIYGGGGGGGRVFVCASSNSFGGTITASRGTGYRYGSAGTVVSGSGGCAASLDTDPPTVTNLNSSADTGDGELREGEWTAVAITQLPITFSEAIKTAAATNPANYSLAGASGAISIDSATYDNSTKTATLNVNGGAALPPDDYTLTVSGAGIEDVAGNKLDGNGDGTGGDDFTRHFTVSSTAPTLLVSSYNNQLLQYDGLTGAFARVFAPYRPLSNPNGITFGPGGDVFVSNLTTHSVLRYDGDTSAFVEEFAVGGGLNGPFGVVFGPDGNLYVAGFGSHNVLRYDGATGAFMDEFVASQSGGMYYAAGLAFGPDGNLYVASNATDQVLRFNQATGAYIDVFANGNGLDGTLGVTFGPDGNLYVVSQSTNSVLRYNGATGAFVDAFVTSGSGGLDGADYLTFGPDRNLYVTSFNTNSVKRYHGETGAYLGDFVSNGSGGLLGPTGLAFSPPTAAPILCPAVLPALDENLISVSAPVGGSVTVTGEAGAVSSFFGPNTVVEVTNSRTGQTFSAPVAPDGSFSVGVAAREDDLLDVVAVDDPGGPCEASSNTVSVVVTLPTVTITSPASGATFNTANVEVSFSVAEWTVGGKGEAHIQFILDGGADSLMFYNGADQVVELNDTPGPTPLAAWVDANTIRFNNLADGTHTLRAELVDADHAPPGNPEADVTITIHVDTTAPSFVDQTLNYDADTLTLSDSGELDEAGTVTLVVKDNGTGDVVASETASTAATSPYTYSLSLTLADPPPAIIRVEKSARDGAGNETPGLALLLDTSVSAVSGRAGVTLPGSGTQIGTTGDVVGVTGSVTAGRPTAAVTAGSNGGAVGVSFTLSPEQDLSLCGPAGSCVVTVGGTPLPATRTVLPDGRVQYSADTTLAPGETANTGLGFDPAQGGAGVGSATDPITGAVAETSGDVAQTTISTDGDGRPVSTVTAGETGGTITISFTLSAVRDLTWCGVLGACRIFEDSAVIDTTRTLLGDGRVRYSATVTLAPGQIKLYSLKRFDTQPPTLNAGGILTTLNAGSAQIAGLAGAVTDDSSPITVTITNARTGGTVTTTAAPDGSFSATLAADSGDTLAITATDAAGNTSQSAQVAVFDAAGLALTALGSLGDLGAVVDSYVAGNYLIVVTADGCYIVDISNPSAPVVVGRVLRSDMPAVGDATSVYVSGDVIYLTSSYGLVIIDWGDPAHPAVIGTAPAPGARGVAVRGQRAYLLYSGGLQIIDLGSGGGPTAIRTMTQFTFGGQTIDLTSGGGGAGRVYLSGDRLIVVHEQCGCVAVFYLGATPDDPSVLTVVFAEPKPRDAVIIGDTLIIGGGRGITVINIGGGGGGGVAQTLSGPVGAGQIVIEDVVSLWGGGSLVVGGGPGGVFVMEFDSATGTLTIIGGGAAAGGDVILDGRVLVVSCGCAPSTAFYDLQPDTEAPTFESPSTSPRLVRGGQSVTIEVTIHDGGGLSRAVCGITLPDGRRIELPMSPVPGEPDRWQAIFPLSPTDASGGFTVEFGAGDFGGNESTAPGEPGTLDNDPPSIGDASVGTPRSIGGAPVAQPGECVTISATVADAVSGVASVEAIVTRPDGSEFSVTLTRDGTSDRFVGTHCVGNDDPGGQYGVKIKADDGAGNSAELPCGCHYAVNHPPEAEAGPDKVSNEGETVNFTGSFADPDPNESHTILWNFGDGTAATGTLTPSHIYGDNGVFTVTLTVTDVWGAEDSDTLTVTMNNLSPALTLDVTGAISFAGGAAFAGRVGVEQTHQASASDPGSDDLTFNWNSGAAKTTFNNGASADASPSPAGVYPFQAADSAKFTFAAAGIYTVSVQVADDDGGAAAASLSKLVTGANDCARSRGFWKHQFSAQGQRQIDDVTLANYLTVVNFTSSVFSESVSLTTLADAASVFPVSGDDMRLKARSQLLAAWLNYAQGSVGWDEIVRDDEHGVGPMPFNQAMAQAEAILLNPNATHAELERAKNLAEAVNHLDEKNGACGDDGPEDDDADDSPDAHDGDDQDKDKDKGKDDDKGKGKGK